MLVVSEIRASIRGRERKVIGHGRVMLTSQDHENQIIDFAGS
jgi:hypothetical protein